MSGDHLITTLKRKIRREEPFAITRFGDGEVFFLLDDNLPYVVKIKERICDRWSYDYPNQYPQAKKDLFEIFRYAVQYSDVLGFLFRDPTQPHSTTRRWVFTRPTAKQLGYLEGKQRIFNWSVMRSRRFGQVEMFKSIIQGKAVHIISPYVEEMRARRIDCLLEADVGYTRVIEGRTLHDYQKHFDVLLDIKEKIVLYGFSNLKSVGPYLKERLGVVAIDMGAILGAWAGREERKTMEKGKMWDYLVVRKPKRAAPQSTIKRFPPTTS